MKRLNIISHKQADLLIERYYEGLTTGEEEKILQKFLSQKHLPEKYKVEQSIFGYYAHKKQKNSFSISPYYKWASVAVVILGTVISVQTFIQNNDKNYALIDGQKITNVQEVKSQALASLNEVCTNNEIESGLENINSNNAEQELSVFAGIE